MDYEELLYTSRIQSAKEAITRVRLSFLLSALASLTIILAIWNGYFSWYRFFAMKESFSTCVGCTPSEPTRIAEEQLLKSWVDSLIITISPLGMRFGVSDLSFVGPVGLLILSTVFVYCARRENHAISYLLIDSKHSAADLRKAIYYGIASHLVFVPVGDTDRQIQSLDYRPGTDNRRSFLRFSFNVLVYLPAIAVLVVFVVDILSVFFLPAPFRQGHTILWTIMGPSEKKQYFLMELVPITLGVLVFLACSKGRRYSKATVAILREYRDRITGSEETRS